MRSCCEQSGGDFRLERFVMPQKVTFDAEDVPSFGVSLPLGHLLAVPSGEN